MLLEKRGYKRLLVIREKEQEKSVDFKGGSLPEDKHRVNTDRIADALCITLAARIFFCYLYSFKR